MRLYYFDRDDTGNKSNRNGKCRESRLPLTALADAQANGDFTVIIRDGDSISLSPVQSRRAGRAGDSAIRLR